MSKMGRPAAYVEEIKGLEAKKLYTVTCIIDLICPPGTDTETRNTVRGTINRRQHRLLIYKGIKEHDRLMVGQPKVLKEAWPGYEWQLTLGPIYFTPEEWQRLLRKRKQHKQEVGEKNQKPQSKQETLTSGCNESLRKSLILSRDREKNHSQPRSTPPRRKWLLSLALSLAGCILIVILNHVPKNSTAPPSRYKETLDIKGVVLHTLQNADNSENQARPSRNAINRISLKLNSYSGDAYTYNIIPGEATLKMGSAIPIDF